MAKNLLVGCTAAVFFFSLYIWKLGTLTEGLSKSEFAARVASGTHQNIVNDPVNAPHKLVQYVLQILDYHGAFWMRSVSAVFALIALTAFYLLLKIWFGKFMALVGTLLFATTPWVVLSARSATPDIMWMSSILFLLAYTLFCRTTARPTIAWFLLVISTIICLYTPGLIWFVAFVLIFKFKNISRSVSRLQGRFIFSGLTLLTVCLFPLVYALVEHLSIFKEVLIIPGSFVGGVAILKNFIWAFSSIGYHLPLHLDYVLGRVAILNIAQVALVLIGIYALWKKARSETAIILALVIVSFLGAAVNNNMLLLTISLPALAILAAAGLRHLYKRWFEIFPFNPIARGFAVCLVALLLVAHVAYGVRYVLLAWPHNMDTRKTYVLK
jgi:hypothetical protein